MAQRHDHDFGIVTPEARAIHKFPIKNIYKHDIELIDVRSSCGCVSGEVVSQHLAPGNTGYVVATFNTRSFKGQHEATLLLKASWSDNGVERTGETSFTVRGNIQHAIVVEPAHLHFAEVAAGTAAQKSLRFSAARDSGLTITAVQCSCEAISAQMPKPVYMTQDIVYRMLVELSSRAPLGQLQERIVVQTSNGTQPSITVPVSGRVVPAIWAAPDSLSLGEVVAGSQVSRKVVVRSSAPCKVDAVRFGGGSVDFRPTSTSGVRHILELSLPMSRELGERKDLLTISTDSGDTNVVPVFSTIVPRPGTAPTDRAKIR